jgi:alginate O-acetyltransferase complex protein AlgI
MIFTSLAFVIFFIVALSSYYFIPYKYRWIQLLLLSYYFYGYWKIEYLSLLIISTVVDFYAGYIMGKKATKRERFPYLCLSLFFNLGLLFTFKYYNFFYDSFISAFQINEEYARIHKLNVLLPVGISFYTFQTMSYTIDVYKGKIQSSKHLGKFASYVAFFPQLVAGPIERASNLLPQFDKKVKADFVEISNGLKLMAWGFFLKIVVADRLMTYIERGYSTISNNNQIDQIFVFSIGLLMIYADFSAYTNIAKGAAQTLGFKLMDNFKQPFFSRSIASFWSKWHISMTTWFGDYVYKPLLASKTGNKFQNILGLYVLFLIIGLWHGANWTFVVWGEYICTLMILENLTRKLRNRFWVIIGSKAGSLKGFVKNFHEQLDYFIMFFLAASTSPFFFAKDLHKAIEFYQSLFNFKSSTSSYLLSSKFDICVISGSLFLMWLVDTLEKRRQCYIVEIVNQQKRVVRYLIYILLIYSIMNFGDFKIKDFVYFQF